MVLDDPFCVRPVNTTSILHTTNSASPFGHHSHGRHFGRGTSNSRRSSAVASRYIVEYSLSISILLLSHSFSRVTLI